MNKITLLDIDAISKEIKNNEILINKLKNSTIEFSMSQDNINSLELEINKINNKVLTQNLLKPSKQKEIELVYSNINFKFKLQK